MKFINQLIDLFDGDAKAAKLTLQEMQVSGALSKIKDTDDWENVKGIVLRHRDYALRRRKFRRRGQLEK